MLKLRSIPRVVVLVLDGVGVALLIYLALRLVNPGTEVGAVQPLSDNTETVKAQVTEIVEAGTVEINGLAQPYQVLRIKILEGPFVGQTFEADYGKSQLASPDVTVRTGEQVLISLVQKGDGSWQAYFV